VPGWKPTRKVGGFKQEYDVDAWQIAQLTASPKLGDTERIQTTMTFLESTLAGPTRNSSPSPSSELSAECERRGSNVPRGRGRRTVGQALRRSAVQEEATRRTLSPTPEDGAHPQ
jgi:hypothetical protein